MLWFTEEPQAVWAARLASLSEGALDNVTLTFALAASFADIAGRVAQGSESVVIIDTVRTLLDLEDESNNAEVARTCRKVAALCQAQSKTLILVHHTRKGGGEHGEGISGAGAFLGVVNVGIELLRNGAATNRRILRGWAHIFEVPTLILERDDDGQIRVVGSPHEVELEVVKQRLLDKLPVTWTATKAVRDLLPDPRPSIDQVNLALRDLALPELTSDPKGAPSEVSLSVPLIERDPSISELNVRGKRVRWRRIPPATSDDPPLRAEVKLAEDGGAV